MSGTNDEAYSGVENIIMAASDADVMDLVTQRIAREFDQGYGLMIMPLDGILDRIRADHGLPPIDYTIPL